MTCPIKFDGRVALITGAGRGLGRQYAMDLGARGASVIVNDVDEVAATNVMQEIRDSGGRAIAAPGSVDNYATACRAVELAEAHFGGLDIVIANAGVLRDRTLLKGRCGRCEYSEVCGGSRSRAYAMTGDYYAEDPGCSYQPSEDAARLNVR